MATYAITVNERSTNGKALMAYLKALGVLTHKLSRKSKSSYLRSQEDKLAGCVGEILLFGRNVSVIRNLSVMYEIQMTKSFRKDTELTFLFTGTGTHSDLFG